MDLSIQQLTDDSKMSQSLRFEALEQVCPREVVSDLLTRCHAWGERERSLNQLLLVYYVIALSLFRRLNLAAVLSQQVARAALALAESVSVSADRRSVGLSSQASGLPRHAPPLPEYLPSDGDSTNARGLSLRVAADGP